jgi:hypothetical protein
MNHSLLVRDSQGRLVACADEVQAEQVRLGAKYARMTKAAAKLPSLAPAVLVRN